MKRQFMCTLVVIILSYLTCIEQIKAAYYNWNWDTGTTEGWMDGTGGTIVSIEDGRNGTFGLGARQPNTSLGLFPKVKIEDQSIDPGSLVGGQFGNYLDMTGEIYVDVNRKMSAGHGDYVDLWVYGENSRGRFHCYPGSGIGRIEDLGDGWFRHYLENRFHFAYNFEVDPSPLERIGSIYLEWNWNYNATSEPVVFDNLTIVPEPTSILLLGIGGLALRKRKEN